MIDRTALKTANARLNAFVDWDDEATGGEGALAGVTVGIKANIAVRGLPCTAGMALYRDRIADRDADAVTRLRAAGATIIGSLNMEEAALGSKSDNPWYGPVQNPHRIGYSPGGSSGGSAAAVAAGLCDAALGTDTMGSIRIPATHCGIYGFKPATDRVSQQGLEPADLAFDAIGPLARDLDLLERMARTISQFGEGAISGSGAVLAGHEVAVDPQIAAAFAAACPPGLPQIRLEWPQSRIRFAGFIHVAKAMDAHLAGSDPNQLSDRLRGAIAYGPRRKDRDWAEDRQILAGVSARLREAVAQYGFLILPTTPNPPFSHNEEDPAAQADFTCLANIAGLPALSLPMGWTADGLPLGLQVIGGTGKEAGLFAIARTFDAGLAAYRRPAIYGY